MKIKNFFFNLISTLLIPLFSVYAIELVNPPQKNSNAIIDQSQGISVDSYLEGIVDSIDILEDENSFDEYLSQNENKLDDITDTIISLAQLGSNEILDDKDELNRDVAIVNECNFKQKSKWTLKKCNDQHIGMFKTTKNVTKYLYKSSKKLFKKSKKVLKKFTKKHKKKILIGSAIVVAAAAITIGVIVVSSVAATAITSTAATATAGFVAANSSDPNDENKFLVSSADEQLQKVLNGNISECKKVLDKNNIVIDQNFYKDIKNSKDLRSSVAHNIFDSYQSSKLNISNEEIVQGHGIIDSLFSKEKTPNFSNYSQDFNKRFAENCFLFKGQEYFSNGYYSQAVENFQKAININPSNPDLYLEKAYANLHLNNLDQSIKDFKAFTQNTNDKQITFDDCAYFGINFSKGMTIGAYESGKHLCSFAANAIVHPINTTKEVYQAFSTLAKLTYSKEWKALREALAPEVCQLISEWETLPVKVKGERSGYIIGKYGADILVPGAVAKVASKTIRGAKELAVVAKKFQRAEKVMELEALAATGGKIGEIVEINNSLILKKIKEFSKNNISNNVSYNKIKFTKHALERAVERNVSKDAIFDALNSPLKIEKVKIDLLGRPSQRYIGKNAEVVINPQIKQVVSVNPTSTKKAIKLIKGINND
jgi:tetratricopeptide (TPR) repeat protein